MIFSKIILVFLSLQLLLYAQLGANGQVVSAEPLATKIGAKILRQGGNGIDAAVAVGFALAVTYPVAGNIGGGGYMVIRTGNGKNVAIDYRERAPSGSSRDMYLDSSGVFITKLAQEGALASGIPGSVAGLIHALNKYGTMPLEQVIQPAIDLATDGYPLSSSNAHKLNTYNSLFKKFPSTRKIFTKENNKFSEGEIFKQTELAKTLKAIRDNGVNGFYGGWVAENIVKEMKQSGGIITHQDLKNYKVVEREAVTGTYRGYQIVSMPPSSSGGVALIQLLNILENFNLKEVGWGSAKYYSILSEAMKRVYADRSEYLGDPDYYHVPVRELTSKEYAKRITDTIGDSVISSINIFPGEPVSTQESEQTTHYSVYDRFGNAVSVTTTINSGFGSGLVIEGCGFFMNNEMDDFSAKPGTYNQFGLLGGTANSIEPGKRMLSSMTPTIVLKKGKPFLILGTPGGSTIITAVLQVILHIIDFDMSLEDAMDAPRIHHQWFPDEIQYEEGGISDEVWSQLEEMGYKKGAVRVLGLVESILVDQNSGKSYGKTDKRGSGLAEGQ